MVLWLFDHTSFIRILYVTSENTHILINERGVVRGVAVTSDEQLATKVKN